MRFIMKIGLVGICVFLMTGAAGVEGSSRVKRCTGSDEGKAHCHRKGPSCDKYGSEARNLCEAGNIIQVSASVKNAVLDLLRHDNLLLPIGENPSEYFPTHVVIAPQDLDEPGTIAFLREAHQIGKTVAIVGATKDEAHTFHRLLRPGQEVNCAPQPGQAQIPLYGLQQSVTRVPGQNASCCLGNVNKHSGNNKAAMPRGAREADRRWLKHRFAATPPQPRKGDVSETSDANTFLTNLATAKHCSFKFPNNGAGSAEVGYFVYGMRNFSDTGGGSCSSVGADYFLVQEAITFKPTSGNWFSTVSANLSDPSGELIDTNLSGLLFTDPQMVTTVETSYTNDSSTTVSGSVGVDSDGPNITFGGSVTSGQSLTYSMPPTTINNFSDPKSLNVDWNFTPQTPIPNTEYDYSPTWMWFIPQDAYPNGGTGNGQVTFTSYPSIVQGLSAGILTDQDYWEGQCNIPYPFSAWTVSPPQLTKLDPNSAQKDGGQFTITGEFLYPGRVRRPCSLVDSRSTSARMSTWLMTPPSMSQWEI